MIRLDAQYRPVEISLSPESFDGFARANGYTKLEPGECVVRAADLETAINELRDLCGPDCTSVAKLTTAIEAAKED